MSSVKQQDVAETSVARNQRREAEIERALEQEAARHQAALKNMHRLRALRLAKEATQEPPADIADRTPVKKAKRRSVAESPALPAESADSPDQR